MSYKKKFIRWYYGEFVNDPQSEVIMFGMVRSYSAQRWAWVVKLLQKYWK